MAVETAVPAIGQGGLGRLPAYAECLLVSGELVEQVVVDVDGAHAGRSLGVDHADHAVGEVDVGAVERTQLTDSQTRERQCRDHGPAERNRSRLGSLGVVHARCWRAADALGYRLPVELLAAKLDDLRAEFVGLGRLTVDVAGGLDQRPRLVQLEAVPPLAPGREPQVFAPRRVARDQSLAHGSVEDPGEELEVGVDRRGLERTQTATGLIDVPSADGLGCSDAVVLALLALDLVLD